MIDKGSLAKIERGCSTDFIGEVFFDEVEAILGADLNDRLLVKCHGMNKRVKSNDVLSADICAKTINSDVREYIQLNLARNSIYHQLPESLFHPLVISSPGMSNKEIVDAIRNNEKHDKELTEFFSPFDTSFFLERVNILNRHLQLFSNPQSRKNLTSLIDLIVGEDLELTDVQKYKLFRFMCHSERMKDNLPLLEDMFHEVFRLKVVLQFVEQYIEEEVFEPLGTCNIGYTSGFNGTVVAEIPGVKASLHIASVPDAIDDIYKEMKMINIILEYFILSSRDIEVVYVVDHEYDFLLGENRLGFDTNI